ncbi:MAG: hypothetical protein V9E88_00240 [Ferruginibacter sp.]|jgi:hypothetical protein
MRLLLSLLFICLLASCKKDRKTCYECDITANNTGTYTYIGCFTNSEWENAVQTDVMGNPISKTSRCRAQE